MNITEETMVKWNEDIDLHLISLKFYISELATNHEAMAPAERSEILAKCQRNCQRIHEIRKFIESASLE